MQYKLEMYEKIDQAGTLPSLCIDEQLIEILECSRFINSL